MQKLSLGVFSEIKVRLKHTLLEATAKARGFLELADLSDESTESNRTFYLVSLMLFISLLFLAPDKIPQAFGTAQINSGIIDKIQEIAKKAIPFIS